jgi:histone H3/H4
MRRAQKWLLVAIEGANHAHTVEKWQTLIESAIPNLFQVVFMRNGELSTAAVRRLIEKAGAERVGDDAVEEMRRILEEYAMRISKEATTLATHAGRKTVKAEDIQLVIKRVQQL